MKTKTLLILIAVISFSITPSVISQDVLSPEALLSLNSVGGIQLSPDGSEVLYSISTPRGPNEEPGGSKSVYMRLNFSNGSSTKLFTEKMVGYAPQWSPDGKKIGFLYRDSGQMSQVYAMPAGGGQAIKLTNSESGISSFKWDPSGSGIAYLAQTAESAREKELNKRGYGFIFYEENLKDGNLFFTSLDGGGTPAETKQLTEGVHVWDFVLNDQGTKIAASISPKNLIDHRYMFRRIYIIDLANGKRTKVSENEGKLGNYTFSPNGEFLAYTAALNINDHQVSQLFLVDLGSGSVSNLTPAGFRGHISWAGWKNNKEILYLSGEGVWPKLNLFSVKEGKKKIILDAAQSGIVFGTPHYTKDLKTFVFTGSTSSDPVNLYSWDGKGALKQQTDINPELKNTLLAKQEVFHYKARDGKQIEGILMLPPEYSSTGTYPLILYIHGGPESHHSNSWLSRYATPGQVMAGKGYMVAYLNYRASTGYGVDFAMEGFEDPAGKEFDDIADAIDYLVAERGADGKRVGLAGGSYGGYASAWFATYYTKYVRAVCMFVGISDLISKRGTTDIPYEDLYVHMGKKLEDQWQLMLERSPVYYAHQSKTATLIYGGAADTRVHPSQSFELYRRMKMNDHPAVRLVQYPGEGHGNRKQVGQIDALYRQMEWLDWYVRDLKPLDGPMPPLDISDRYGLDWDF